MMEKKPTGSKFFRDAQWVSAQRIRLYCSIFLIVAFAVLGGLLVTSHQGIDWHGKPLGTDFVSFWSASDVALQGHPADVYGVEAHKVSQLRLFPQIAHYGYSAFFYPPTFLLICLPLAVLPYFYALCLWLSVTGYACWRAVKPFLPNKTPWVVCVGFPAIFSNILHGQNAFLSCALFAGGVHCLVKKPVCSGILFGFLCFKPHLVLCVPLVLVAARLWKALCAFMLTVALFVLVSWAVLGTSTWLGFINHIPAATNALEKDQIGYAKMVSVFAAVRLLHGSVFLSYSLQVFVSAVVLSLLLFISFCRRASLETGVMLIITALIVTPFLLDYDLMLMAPVLAWTVAQAQRRGFMPYERFIVACAFLLPMFVRPVASIIHIPVGPLVMLGLAYIVLRYAVE